MTARLPDSSRASSEKPRIRKILALLTREYPEPRCALEFGNPLELIVATVLSAQCTDARVNQVTRHLFAKYRTAGDYAQARLPDLEIDIRSTGFYRNKARSLQRLCRALVEDHEGRVPSTMDQLVALPGVGRKTANLVLAEGFGLPGMVVDTHVSRLSQRLGLTRHANADKIEMDLVKLMPPDQWNRFSLRLILHGRAVCKARTPKCEPCTLLKHCPTGLDRV